MRLDTQAGAIPHCLVTTFQQDLGKLFAHLFLLLLATLLFLDDLFEGLFGIGFDGHRIPRMTRFRTPVSVLVSGCPASSTKAELRDASFIKPVLT